MRLAKLEHKNLISYTVFILTIIVVCLHLISVIFPAFIVSTFSIQKINLELFELGENAIPLIVSNILLFGFGLMYFKRLRPQTIHRGIRYLLSFEISRKSASVIVIIVLSIYVVFSIPDLTINEASEYGDYSILDEALKIWPSGEASNPVVDELRNRYVKMFLVSTSLNLFNNVKIIPFMGSVALVIVTYFLTKELSGKRFSGIISMIVLLQSYTFLKYDTIAVYENFWTLFYVVSLYAIYKKWYISTISYMLSIFSKAITLAYLPMSLFLVYRADIDKRKKIFLVASYFIMVLAALIIFQIGVPFYYETSRIDFTEFWQGLTVWSYSLRFDYLILFAILPLTVALFIKSRQGFMSADSVLVLILGAIISNPLLQMVSDIIFIYPYRFVPLIVFFAIGIGILISGRDRQLGSTI